MAYLSKRFAAGLFHALFLLCVVVMVTACGFHLRGSVDLPKNTDHLAIVDGETASEIATSLRIQLRRNGVEPLQNVDDARLVVDIQSEQFQRRVLTVSSAGQVQEFEITYLVNYSIINKDDSSASLINQSLSLRRDLRFDPNAVLGKTSEEVRLREDMLNAAAEQILRRLPKVVDSDAR